jgi:osmotically-inducible protein OsmY
MKRHILGGALGIALLLALGGCQARGHDGTGPGPGQGTSPADRAAKAVSQAAHTAATAVDNVAVTAKVKNALSITKGLDTSHLEVHTTQGGTVTLSGSVPAAAQRELAAKMAAHIDGVKAVRNELKVAPVTASTRT